MTLISGLCTLPLSHTHKKRKTERQTNRQTDRHRVDRQIYTHTHIHTQRETDSHTHTERDRQTDRQTQRERERENLNLLLALSSGGLPWTVGLLPKIYPRKAAGADPSIHLKHYRPHNKV